MAKQADKEPVVKKEGNTYVTKPFRDKDNFELAYEVDQDVSTLSEERIAELAEKGLVETFVKQKDADPPKV